MAGTGRLKAKIMPVSRAPDIHLHSGLAFAATSTARGREPALAPLIREHRGWRYACSRRAGGNWPSNVCLWTSDEVSQKRCKFIFGATTSRPSGVSGAEPVSAILYLQLTGTEPVDEVVLAALGPAHVLLLQREGPT